MTMTHYLAYTKMKNKLHLFDHESRTPTCGQGTSAGMIAFFSGLEVTITDMANRAYEIDRNICKKCFKVEFVEMGSN